MATANVKPSYQITPPEPFDFSAPKEWPKWIRRFERFRQASQLSKSDQESQVISTLIYSMGDQADDILMSFKLSSEEMKNYDTIVKKKLTAILSHNTMSSLNAQNSIKGNNKLLKQ